jgi:type II secretory pathway pseudopilin PulG
LAVAIIGFALVAIIGVLPAGLNVQKENREETIIVQDANYLIDAIRGGARGLDDLTNYVEAITNYVTYYNANNDASPVETRGYTFLTSATNSTAGGPVLTSGSNIVGLLSTPKYLFEPDGKPFLSRETPVHQGFYSNYVVAYVRALNGPAVEKAPQTNAAVSDLSFRYRLICELSPYAGWDTNWFNTNLTMLTTNEIAARVQAWQVARTLQGNMSELRLVFRWPVNSRREAGNQRQVFRTLLGGAFTNAPSPSEFWFVRERNYLSPL